MLLIAIKYQYYFEILTNSNSLLVFLPSGNVEHKGSQENVGG